MFMSRTLPSDVAMSVMLCANDVIASLSASLAPPSVMLKMMGGKLWRFSGREHHSATNSRTENNASYIGVLPLAMGVSHG